MKILSLNSGSSSIKYGLYETKNGLKELIQDQIETKKPEKVVSQIIKIFLKKKLIQSPEEITQVGHRVVHGGEKYYHPTKIDKKTLKDLWVTAKLAPLHNPINLRVIEETQKVLPHAIHIGVFDTAFYHSLPEKAFLYALPYSFYKKHGIRRYGFHGTNHQYVVELARAQNKKASRIISCHIGNGSSITASLNGKALDTSMGFTPLEGLPMGTRSGSIDPGIILHLANVLKIPTTKIADILNYKSGLLGFSEISSDMRKIHAKYLKNNPRAILTIELLAYQITKTISSYLPAIGGLDTLIFTGGIGEHAFYLRTLVAAHLKFLGLSLNTSANTQNKPIISAPQSKVKVLIIPANEELAIARQLLAST